MSAYRFLQMYLAWMLTACICIQGDSTEKFHTLYRDFFSWRLEDSPEFATYVGVYRYNDRLQSFNATQIEDRYVTADNFLFQLETEINETALDKRDQMNYKILRDVLQTFVNGFAWSRFATVNPLNFLEGNQLDPHRQVEATPFDTRGDFENFLARLENTPQQLSEYIELYRTAISINRTSHNVSVDRIPSQIERLLEGTERSPFYKPFLWQLEQLPMSHHYKHQLRRRAQRAITRVLSSFRTLKTFLENEYLPSTRPSWGVGSLEYGREFYRACLRWHLSTDMSPEEVHQIGLQEVERIVGQMRQIMDKQGFEGTLTDYFAMLRNDSSLHMNSEEELLEGYRKIIHERVNPGLSRVFKNLPDLPLKVERMPFEGPGGQYIPGSEDGTRPGIFMVNLDRPHEIGTYIMVPITLHESNPGHHLQSSYALRANLPDFRRNMDMSRYYEVPYHFPFYTAYFEGWALYAESLGEELNIYRDDYELMGRYSSEVFRACRLVVDTGLHYYGWQREEAIQFMLNYTSFSRAEMTTEIDRYITWPGQACAYKIGEIKIKELRRKAEEALGSLFDIRDFHAVVLENGPMPLSILEEILDDWLDNYNSTQLIEAPCSNPASSPSVAFLVANHASVHSVSSLVAVAAFFILLYQ